ncbi:MAG: histone deacetylase [Candidatus Roseilinea sp.]|nr:MAG: histone deacetylase [Candidatus Roseilinea sp.]
MPAVGYLYDPIFLAHDLPGHPENAQRLQAIMGLLRERDALASLTPLPFRAATFEQLTVLHSPLYVSRVYALSERGRSALNPDTYIVAESFNAAAMAVGASLAATEAVLKGKVQRAFALVRPPGHHAFADHGEGFCLFNNIAFAAKRALDDMDADHDYAWSPSAMRNHRHARPERVMIVDFDVHHGNGTQALFYDDPRVLYVSIHEYGWVYPGSGAADERGRGAGRGATINVPLPPETGDFGYALVFDEILVPAARRFAPNLLLVSAGFDAHWRDPLAHMRVSLAGFARMMRLLCDLSDELCGGRMVVVLEGGYDLQALSYGVLNALRIMQGSHADVEDPLGPCPAPEAPVEDLIAAFAALNGLK